MAKRCDMNKGQSKKEEKKQKYQNFEKNLI
jgi:hypothetical protein